MHFLYVRYAADVLFRVRSLVRGDREAEEITQEVFRDLSETLGAYEARQEPFTAWLSVVAHHAALEHRSTSQRSPSSST